MKLKFYVFLIACYRAGVKQLTTSAFTCVITYMKEMWISTFSVLTLILKTSASSDSRLPMVRSGALVTCSHTKMEKGTQLVS